MSLQEAALSRKEKLAALKKRKELHDDSSADPSPSTTSDVPKEVFRFRNYDPATGGARKHARTEELETVEAQVEGMASRVIAEDELRRAQELDLINIQPKKPNWDLKRDLERKLIKLKSSTDSAISQLIRKRLQAEKGGEAAAVALVAGGTREGEVDLDSDEEDD